MKRLILSIIVSLITVYTTKAQDKEFVLQGMIGGLQDQTIYLYKNNGEKSVLIDSVKIKNGDFKFSGKCKQAFAAELRITKWKKCKLFLSPTNMNIIIHAKDFKHKFAIGKLKGSPAQDRYEDFQIKLKENNKQKLKIADNLEIPEVYNDSIKKAKFMAEYKRLNQFKNKYYYKYASSPVIPYLIYQDYFRAKKGIEYVKEQLKTLKQANPNGLYVNNLEKRVNTIETLNGNGQFPYFKAKTLNGDLYDLAKQKGKPILLYIWRTWTQEQNKEFYTNIQEITSTHPTLEVVSIMRNSSFNMVQIKGSAIGKNWRPESKPELNCIEIESLDHSVDFIRYLDRSFKAFLLDSEGNIIYKQNKFDPEILKTELSKHLSN